MNEIIKFITMAEVVPAVLQKKQTYMIIAIDEFTTLGELDDADGFMTVTPREPVQALDSEPEPEPEPKKEPKKQPESKAQKPKKKTTRKRAKRETPDRLPLDHDTIMALHKAEWPAAKIADELGCSLQTVYNHIAKDSHESDNAAKA